MGCKKESAKSYQFSQIKNNALTDRFIHLLLFSQNQEVTYFFDYIRCQFYLLFSLLSTSKTSPRWKRIFLWDHMYLNMMKWWNWRLQRSGSWRASVELMGKELKASVLFSKRQRQPGCWSLNCFSPSQQGWAGEGAVPWTNGAHGTNGSRRVPQSAIGGACWRRAGPTRVLRKSSVMEEGRKKQKKNQRGCVDGRVEGVERRHDVECVFWEWKQKTENKCVLLLPKKITSWELACFSFEKTRQCGA